MNSRFDLEKAISAWRRSMEYNRAFLAEDVDELERHVRDQVEALATGGMNESEAFRRTLREMGRHGDIEIEYQKVYWGKRRRRHEMFDEIVSHLSMLRNYLRTAHRNLLRQKSYAIINIAGLSIGMTCCLLILQFISFELSFDSHHSKAERLYRVLRGTAQNATFLEEKVWTGYAEAPTYAAEVPGILRYARLHVYFGNPAVSARGSTDVVFKEERVYFADPQFLDMFTVPFVAGDRSNALTEPHRLLISESAAQRYFGEAHVVGEVLSIRGSYAEGDYVVTGVFEDVPAASHLQYDLLLPMRDLLALDRYRNPSSGWSNNNFYTYVEASDAARRAEIEDQLTQSYTRHQQDALRAANRTVRMRLEPLRQVHFNLDVAAPYTLTGDRITVYFFSIIALLTLVIAWINYVNSSTARALDRAREVGIRKVVGANRRQLVVQFLLESASINLTALILAIGLSYALAPIVSRLAEVNLSGVIWSDAHFWSALFIVFGAGSLVSGAYPALVLSAFKPSAVLKGTPGITRFVVRKALVVVQFAVSIGLIAGTFVVHRQIEFMRSMDLGLRLDQVLVVKEPWVLGDGTSRQAAFSAFKQELAKLPGVVQVAESASVPGKGFGWNSSLHRVNADPSTQRRGHATAIDPSFLDVYEIELTAGRPFTESISNREDTPVPALLNETGIRELGFSSADEALGEDFTFGGAVFRIHGVVEDFNWSSAHEAQDAVLFYPVGPWDPGGIFSARIGAGDVQRTIVRVRNLYETVFPGNPFDYFFAHEEFDRLYREDRRFNRVFSTFAGLAILIACVGLFGLAVLTARQRTREIGIRKVLGASVANITALLSREFALLVLFAFAAAVPPAYFIVLRWLEGFAYRIKIGPGIFLLTGICVLLVALATVSFQSIKAALADPVKSLRHE